MTVEDAAEAILLAAEKYAMPDPANLGFGEEISIRDPVEQVLALVGYEGAVNWDSAKPDGQPRRCLDISRALSEFGWRAKTSLRDGLRKTIHWFARILELTDERRHCRRFLRLAITVLIANLAHSSETVLCFR